MKKDFADFVKQFSVDDIMEMVNKSNNQGIPITLDSSDLEKSLNSFATAQASVNFNLTIELLYRYHNWLNSDEQN